ncbi:MAG: class I SAM-dependent methyltransferase [Nocardioides sp.]|uniref:class I SAM-dependent methyltransferase n=1 Tax=Nocardioides sp. TaxID=35761 RepID=UPI003F129209
MSTTLVPQQHTLPGARPEVAAPSRRGLRARAARAVMRQVAGRVPVELRLPDGSTLGNAVRPLRGVVQIVRPEAMYARLADNPKIGIGEGYTAGDWRAGDGYDLAEVLLPFAERLSHVVPRPLARLRRLVDQPLPDAERNTLSGSRRNIEAHYDLSNDLFATFLDPTLSYSSALFDPAEPFAAQGFEEAQLRKVHAVLDLAEVRAGSTVLEIGTGWGTLAIEAARRGAQVTTLTLSTEQAELARERVRDAGLEDRVEVRLEDYREATGRYDAVVSVEMVEAVGEEYWPTYFSALDRLLAPGGVVAVQAILMSHDRYLATRRSYGWIQKHIFPGGLIPSVRAIEETTERHTALRVDRVHAFGQHYAETLRRWRAAFVAAAEQVDVLGFDESFRRTWEFYLAYCEAGFTSGYLDVAQIRLTRPEEGVA